jgi:hypothetical protein
MYSLLVKTGVQFITKAALSELAVATAGAFLTSAASTAGEIFISKLMLKEEEITLVLDESKEEETVELEPTPAPVRKGRRLRVSPPGTPVEATRYLYTTKTLRLR